MPGEVLKSSGKYLYKLNINPLSRLNDQIEYLTWIISQNFYRGDYFGKIKLNDSFKEIDRKNVELQAKIAIQDKSISLIRMVDWIAGLDYGGISYKAKANILNFMSMEIDKK